MNKILIAGGTGFIGSGLSEMWLEKGYTVNILTRSARKSKQPGVEYYTWNPDHGELPQEALAGVKYIINLAGENISGKRWNKAVKERLISSRLNSTRTLVQALKRDKAEVQAMLSASAIGYYGANRPEAPLTEDMDPGSDFLAQLCIDWEAEAHKIPQDIRLLVFRVGIVFSSREGALQAMARPVKLMVGAPLGSGKQLVPWIHADDLCRMMIWALESPELRGTFNACGPNPASNKEITRTIARELHRPLILPPVPGFVMRILLGEMSDSVLASYPVSSRKIQQAGFVFEHPDLDEAIHDLYMRQV